MREPTISAGRRRFTALVGWSVLLLVGGAAVVLAGVLPPGGTFVDDDGSVHEGFIEAIAAEEITLGCNPPANDRYCPDDFVTRAQMATFLVRALGLPPEPGDRFTDDAGSVHEDNINSLAAAGITSGCNPPANTLYCPNDFVTRAQMGTFLARALGLAPSDDDGDFTDHLGSVHRQNINAIRIAGITQGCNPPDNTLYCPAEFVTRAQMATFLGRALGLEPMSPPPRVQGELTVVFVPVRQGDAALYEGPCGDVGLIDTNRFREDDVLAAMDAVGTRHLTWISVSHYDADHVGGIVDVATAAGVTVDAVYDRGGDRDAKDTQTYRDYYDWVTAAGIRQPVDIGDTFTLCSGADRVTFTVVSAGTDGTAAGGVPVSDENDRGLCLHVEYGDFDLATCGDISGTDEGSLTDVETAVASTIGDVEVAKVNHHGSANSSNSFYVTTLSAQASIISVGANGFGHPDPAVVARWDAVGTVYQTQNPADNTPVDGTITITTDGLEDFTVSTSQGSVTVYGFDDS